MLFSLQVFDTVFRVAALKSQCSTNSIPHIYSLHSSSLQQQRRAGYDVGVAALTRVGIEAGNGGADIVYLFHKLFN